LFGKSGNSIPIGSLYLIIGEMLGIPIKTVDIPKQNLLCYVESAYTFRPESKESILFFIDPLNGQVYTHRDIENYLKKIHHTPYPFSVVPSENHVYIGRWIREIAKCAKEKKDDFTYEALKKLAGSLDL
jgi:regulator of sirC expression with transglutaminase-like and TPR domain